MADFDAIEAEVERTIADFRDEVAAYYDEAAREKGFITIADRYGTERAFPLLSVSAGVVRIRPESRQRDEDGISPLIAGLKKIKHGLLNNSLPQPVLRLFRKSGWRNNFV